MLIYITPEHWYNSGFSHSAKNFFTNLLNPIVHRSDSTASFKDHLCRKQLHFSKRLAGIESARKFRTFAPPFLSCPSPLVVSGIWIRKFLVLSNYGHTQLNPPHPVRSAQLNSWWQSQYYGGGPHGNTLCCNFLVFTPCEPEVSFSDWLMAQGTTPSA